MHIFKKSIFAALLAVSVGGATAAAAKVSYITSAGVYDDNQIMVNGQPAFATAIQLTILRAGGPSWVFCVDIAHPIDLYLGAQFGFYPPLEYKTGPIMTKSNGALSGTGDALSMNTSGEIQTLARKGIAIASLFNPDQDQITAIQGAIWAIEYGYTYGSETSQISGTPRQNQLIAQDVAFAEKHPAGYFAPGLISVGDDGTGFGATQAFATGVPEPATWGMLIVGLGLTGATLRRRPRPIPAVATKRK